MAQFKRDAIEAQIAGDVIKAQIARKSFRLVAWMDSIPHEQLLIELFGYSAHVYDWLEDQRRRWNSHVRKSSRNPQPKPRRQRKLVSPETITPTTPLRLDVAAQLAFPDGSMTASGLRREGRRGHLVIERIAGKDFTTLHHIEDMRLKCRDQQKAQGSGSNPKSVTPTASSSATQPGSSATERVRSARAALEQDRAGAERALAEYIASKYQVPRERNRHPAEILVLDVLNIYLADKAQKPCAARGNQAAGTDAR